MDIIESVLTGNFNIREFRNMLRTDKALQDRCNKLIPKEAIGHPDHPFWQVAPYSMVKASDFCAISYMERVACFKDTLGGDLNLSSTLGKMYLYYYPHVEISKKFKKAFSLFLDVAGSYLGGPEVDLCIEKIVGDALMLPTITKQREYARKQLKITFHLTPGKYPHWIQGAEWPMGSQRPMEFIQRKNIPDGAVYLFRDVDSGEQRTITQYY